jgi:hypothetical protein
MKSNQLDDSQAIQKDPLDLDQIDPNINLASPIAKVD